MITTAANKMLDITEASVSRAAGTCMRLGAWVVPFCYRRECARLTGNELSKAEQRAEEENVVRMIGTVALKNRCGEWDISTDVIQSFAHEVGPELSGTSYRDVFDPYRARLLETVAPLHEPNK